MDALSIIECRGEAVALNSTANVNRLLRMLEQQKPSQKLIIAMDADDAGKRAQKELAEGLSKLSIPYYIVSDWNGCKDANELLVKSRADFEKLISKAREEQPVLNEADREVLELLNQNRMDNCIGDLLSTISERSIAPRVSTGFPNWMTFWAVFLLDFMSWQPCPAWVRPHWWFRCVQAWHSRGRTSCSSHWK